MRIFIFLLGALLSIASFSLATAGPVPLLLKGRTVAPAGFTSVGDIAPGATLFFSCARAYSAATRGTRACNICYTNAGVNVACADVSSDATTGVVTIPSIGGQNCATVTCTVKIRYDQTGNGHDSTQTSVASQPAIVIAAQGSATNQVSVAGSSEMDTASLTAIPQPYSLLSVSYGSGGTIIGPYNLDINFCSSDGSNYIFLPGFSTTTYQRRLCLLNSASSTYWLDGTPLSGNAGTASLGSVVGFLSAFNFTNAMTGRDEEDVAYPSDISANFSAIDTNQKTFYGL